MQMIRQENPRVSRRRQGLSALVNTCPQGTSDRSLGKEWPPVGSSYIKELRTTGDKSSTIIRHVIGDCAQGAPYWGLLFLLPAGPVFQRA